MKSRITFSSIFGYLGSLTLLASCILGEESCERLKASLSFPQDKAPKDLSGVLPVVVERINKELDGVVDVQVDWTGGDLHGRVGEHIINCTVTRMVASTTEKEELSEDKMEESSDRREVIQCFQLPFSIEDTNECKLPIGHPMAHRCHESAMCVNTIGSYECLCPRLNEKKLTVLGTSEFFEELVGQDRSSWEKSFETHTLSSCSSSVSTYGCCSTFADDLEGSLCRAAFRCPKDPCASPNDNTCAINARCIRNESPLPTRNDENYKCVCKNGLMGNGHKCRQGIDPEPRPMVTFDGITPTEETKKNNFYCGCSKPEIDACEGFPQCKGKHEVCVVKSGNIPVCDCKSGYVNNNDGWGCVDESPPDLKLRNDPAGDQTLRLRQGDFYTEYSVDIVDENPEDYLRTFRISYSKPLPPGCMTSIGSFHVNYTVATPWTSYQFIRVTRRVEVADIDECNINVNDYKNTCPSLIPQCDTDAGAKCVNTNGSYECKCPEHSTGDGFKKIFPDSLTPESYNGGTGCVDTSKPRIEILGPNPKIFKVSDCFGVRGIIGGADQPENVDICKTQRSQYGDYIKDLIRSTIGAELCATEKNRNPKPHDCVRATDHSHKGVQDITDQVEIGEAVQKSQFHWVVPYNVMDEAGNRALTAWRDVMVEEVDIFDLELKTRQEIVAEHEIVEGDAIKKAVERAVADERRRFEKERKDLLLANKNERKDSTSCPTCPTCAPEVATDCTQYCESMRSTESCPIPPSTSSSSNFFSKMFSIIACITVGIFVLRFMLTLIFNPSALFGKADYSSTNTLPNDRTTTTTYDSQRTRTVSTPIPSNSILSRSSDREGGIFSSQSDRLLHTNDNSDESNRDFSSPFRSPLSYQSSPHGESSGMNGNIYTDDIISPSKTGDSRRRR